MPFGPWGAGAIGAGASLISGGMMSAGQNQANADSERLARDLFTRQEEMSNTAHRREVHDLREAGLNPILSATGGSGASTGSQSAPKMENAAINLQPMVASAMDVLRLDNETKQVGSTTALQTAQGAAATAAAVRDSSSAKEADQRTKVLDTQMEAIKAQAKRDKNQADMDLSTQKYDHYNKRIQQGLGTINSAKDLLNPFKFGSSKPWEGRLPDGTKYNKGTGEIIP